jgi:DnaK suppressor protein
MNIEKNKESLLAEKKLLESEMGDIGQLDKKTSSWEATPEIQTDPTPDENDMADRFENFEERTGTMSVLDARLADINHALKAIEDGTYGICEICGKPIEEDRLEANPAARTCKACMEKVI